MDFGVLNGHACGILMKEWVRRAIVEIRNHRFAFEIEEKQGHDNRADFLTSADQAAQGIYERGLKECFPDFGIVAEESNLRVEPKDPSGRNIFFTVDPLDGTRAYIRRQSDGIGTMISLVCDGEVLAAYVGDVMTQEIYGYRPGSEKVFRISDYESYEELKIDVARPLTDQYILMREHPFAYPDPIADSAFPAITGRLFRGMNVIGGSIGLTMAKLWKGEVGAVALLPGRETPWDRCPVYGISKKLGFIHLAHSPNGFVKIEPEISMSSWYREAAVLVIHHSRLGELKEWEEARKLP